VPPVSHAGAPVRAVLSRTEPPRVPPDTVAPMR
jgi:hypothetical protein